MYRFFAGTVQGTKMKQERRTGNRTHILTTTLALIAAVVILFAFPARTDAETTTITLGGVNISSYNDNATHSAGASGSPSIPGWTSGSFRLSADRSTLYLSGFTYSDPNASLSNPVIYANSNMTVHFSGNNKLGKSNFIYLPNGDSYYDLVLEGDSDSYIELGKPSSGEMMGVRNLTFSRCTFTSGADIAISGTMSISSGLFRTAKLQANALNITGGRVLAQTTESVGVDITKELTITEGSLLTTENNCEIKVGSAKIEGGTIYANGEFYALDSLKQTGGSVEAADIVYVYDSLKMLECSGGSIKGHNGICADGSVKLSGNGKLEAGKIFRVLGSFTGSGGSATVTGRMDIAGDMTIGGSSVTVEKSESFIYGNLTVTNGTLTCKNDDPDNYGFGMEVHGDVRLSGGTIRAYSSTLPALYTVKTVNISGGYLSATSEGDKGLSAKGFSMSGGEAYASSGAQDGVGLEVHASEPVLQNDIWMIAPDNGHFKKTYDNRYIAYDREGQPATEVWLKKISDIEISEEPTAKLYNGDAFDPTGLVLNVYFEDGSTAALSYNDQHKEMFTFSLGTNQPLSVGRKTVKVSCLGNYDYLYVTVNELGKPELSGTATYNSASLSWTEAEGAQYYRVFAGEAGSGISRYIGETTGTTYTAVGLKPETSMEFTVYTARVSNLGAVIEEESNVLTLTTEPEPPQPEEPETDPPADEPESPAPVITPPKTDDPAGTVFNLLQARSGKVTKQSVQVVWRKVTGAKSYVVYGNRCGSRNRFKKLTTTAKTKMTYKKVAGSKVKKGTYYKFIVYALDDKGEVISTSKTVHVATPGGKVGNDKKVTTAAKKNKVTIRKGRTFRLRAKSVPKSKKLKVQRHRKISYESSNNKIATVSSKGVIKGKRKGSCYVFAYTQNGVFARVKVRVK